MGRTTINLSTVAEGSRLIIGNKQIEVRELAFHLWYIVCRKSGKVNFRL